MRSHWKATRDAATLLVVGAVAVPFLAWLLDAVFPSYNGRVPFLAVLGTGLIAAVIFFWFYSYEAYRRQVRAKRSKHGRSAAH